MKKVLSLVLALTLVLAMAVPAFASTTTNTTLTDPSKLATGGTVKVTGTTSVGVVSVTIPTAGAVVVNPYGLKYSANVNGTDLTDNTDQIIYPAQWISSNSTSKMEVYANVTGTVAGNAKLVSEFIDNTADHVAGQKYANNAFVVFQTGTVVIKDPSAIANTDATGFDTVNASLDTAANATTGVVKNMIVSSRGTTTKVGELAASTATDDATKTNNLPFKLSGVAEKQPDTPWTTKDTVTASIVFTFVPVAA